MNDARTVVEMLIQYQTEVVFGVPGDTSIGLYEALYDVQPKIRHVMARDERTASFMPDYLIATSVVIADAGTPTPCITRF
jgi:acetolactate synthase-1/2/3 large subunit